MVMAPHWIDDLFADGKASPASITQALIKGPEFTAAVEKALEAFAEAEERLKQISKLMAPSPVQEARRAFLEALGQEGHG